jgi:hypothetical protein
MVNRHMEQTVKILTLVVVLALSGCATLERHPVLTAVGSAIIVGSIAASVEQRQGRQVAPIQAESCHATFQCGVR